MDIVNEILVVVLMFMYILIGYGTVVIIYIRGEYRYKENGPAKYFWTVFSFVFWPLIWIVAFYIHLRGR